MPVILLHGYLQTRWENELIQIQGLLTHATPIPHPSYPLTHSAVLDDMHTMMGMMVPMILSQPAVATQCNRIIHANYDAFIDLSKAATLLQQDTPFDIHHPAWRRLIERV